MDDDLQHMKNLGKTSVQWLRASGINNATDLRRLGAIHAYKAVKTRGFKASKVLLYSIEGALLGVRWNTLPSERKALLNLQLQTLVAGSTHCKLPPADKV